MNHNIRTFYAMIFLAMVFICGCNQAMAKEKLYPEEVDNIRVFKTLSPLVVNVHNMQRVSGSFFESYDVQAGSGSGFIWDHQGHVVTNYHVIYGAKSLAVSLHNGETVRAKVIGVEPRKDIAVLKIGSEKALEAIKPLSLLKRSNNKQLEVGQKTIAIGNPFGLDRTMTTGIISALNRRIPGVGGVTIRDMIQTDASINPGNSGGPLLNSQGELIGMNTVIYSNSGSSSGVGFAVPVNAINTIVTQIINQGYVSQPGLGIQILSDRVTEQWGIKGVVVGEIVPNSPAAKAGIRQTFRDHYGKFHVGDVIMAIDNQAIANYDDLYNALSSSKIGQELKLTINRQGKKYQVGVKTVDISRLEDKAS